MPIKDLFERQINALCDFMDLPGKTMLALQRDPEMEQPLMRILSRLDEKEDNANFMLVSQIGFQDENQFFSDLLKEISESNERHRQHLAEQGVTLPPAPPQNSVSPLARFGAYVSQVGDCLPEWTGFYILILDPAEVSNDQQFRQSMIELVKFTSSTRTKYIVLDQRQHPRLGDIDEFGERATIQTFYVDPNQIEQQIKNDLENSARLSPLEIRQYTAMQATFDAINNRLDEAEQKQKQTVKLAETEGSPPEQANAYYNLGNTYLKKGESELALDCFHNAVQICLKAQAPALLASSLTNMGIALFRLHQTEIALSSFDAARETFAAINNKPGEAYVLDCKAHILAIDERSEEAEKTWFEALAVYDGITSNVFQDVRNSGREQIIEKLKRFYDMTGQTSKLKALDKT